MRDIRFEWDPAKAAANLRKHGVAFAEAETVFSIRIISARKATTAERTMYVKRPRP